MVVWVVVRVHLGTHVNPKCTRYCTLPACTTGAPAALRGRQEAKRLRAATRAAGAASCTAADISLLAFYF